LHALWGDRVHFVDVMVRQAHPGPAVPPYATIEQKLADAEAYRREAGITWPVLADDLDGTVHQTYGGLTDPAYLIDADGRVAYYNMWAYSPVLHQAIEALLAQGGRGVVLGEGIDRTPHLLPAMADGWPGIRRGLSQSYVDMETSLPGSATALWLTHQLRPLLAPVALRATPLPPAVQAGILLGVSLLVGAQIARLQHARATGDASPGPRRPGHRVDRWQAG